MNTPRHEAPENPDDSEAMTNPELQQIPEKRRVTLHPDTGAAETIATAPGTVGILDKLKGTYKWLIATIGFLLVLLNQLLVFTDILPQKAASWINVGIAVLTSFSVFLKSNEHWFDGTTADQAPADAP